MRSETVIILSCIEPSTLSSFPRELDPCVNEAMRDPGVVERMSANSSILGVPEDAEKAREKSADVREEIAKVIQTVTVPIAKEITTPTPVPGVVIPKPGTGLPQVPVTIPTEAISVPDVKIGGNTIEFQEIIPGIRPPAIPLLIPGLEKLPILPGWTIRSQSGGVIAQGDRLPTVPIGVFGIPIPPELDKPVVAAKEAAEASLEGGYTASTGLGPEREHYLEAQILADTEGEFESAVTVEEISEEALDMGTSADEDDMGFEDVGDDDVEI